MKLRGRIRSTHTWTRDGSGLTAGEARAEAVSDVPEAYELIDVTTVSAKPGEPVTVRAVARPEETKDIESAGESYEEAVTELASSVDDEWQLLEVTIVHDRSSTPR